MKDIDFDELDKAVNSLMAGSSLKTTPPPTDDEPVLTITTTQQVPERPASPATTPTTGSQRPSSPSTSQASPLIPKRRSGRFMDVVHTSSDMRSPARPVSRSGIAVTPPVQTRDEVTQPQPADVVEPQPSAFDKSPSPSWPDPVALSEPDTVSEPQEPETKATTPSSTAAFEPLESPFLPNARVEKRPLGAAASASQPAESLDTPAIQHPEDQLPAEPSEQLPEELQNELLAVEADDSGPATLPEQPLVESAPTAAPHQAADIATSSILPQYTPEPSSSPQESGDIFDTENYHQPLAHPAKKKSGWLWVLWIVLLILVGAAGGAALYLFVL